MTPLDTLPNPLSYPPADVVAPRFFLDGALDATADAGDWWLDLGAVDLPGSLAV